MMEKVYKFSVSKGQKMVSLNGQPLQLRRLKRERDEYVSPDRLGLSILSDAVGNDAAKLLGHEFQKEIVDRCDAGEELTADEIQEWVDFECRIGASVQSVGLTTNGTNDPVVNAIPLTFPRLLRVKKRSV
jgi:hypothetical protein